MFGHWHGHRIPLGILGILAIFALFSWIVMLLWNAVMPGLTGAGSLNFPQAAGLLALCRILFGSLGPGFRGKGLHGHHPGMGREQRETLARRWRERFHGYSGPEDSCGHGYDEKDRADPDK